MSSTERTRVTLRPARSADAVAVAACVQEAYRHYVTRIGTRPGPMLEDYADVIAREHVTVAERDGSIAGLVVLAEGDEGFLVANVAVAPAFQGQGIGRALLEFAEHEARRRGHPEIYLYTHEKMVENRALYAKLGYSDYDLRRENGFTRVYMRKSLK